MPESAAMSAHLGSNTFVDEPPSAERIAAFAARGEQILAALDLPHGATAGVRDAKKPQAKVARGRDQAAAFLHGDDMLGQQAAGKKTTKS